MADHVTALASGNVNDRGGSPAEVVAITASHTGKVAEPRSVLRENRVQLSACPMNQRFIQAC